MTPTETVSRLRRLADDWHKEEKQLCDQFGNEIIPRSMRARRIKDTKAIDAAIEMIERLEAAESDALEQARLNGVGASREAALMAKLEAAEKELESWKGLAKQFGTEADACATHLYFAKDELNRLRARIEAMEKQEPVARTMGEIRDWVSNGDGTYSLGGCLDAFMPLPDETSLYTLPGAQQCKNCNGMGDRFDPSGEKIPCDLCESNLEEIRVLVAEAAHDIVSGSDFWLSTSLAAKKIYALPGAKGEGK